MLRKDQLMQSIKIKIITVALLFIAMAAVFIVMNLTDNSFSIKAYYNNNENISDESAIISEYEQKKQEILFSAEGYFYTETVMLELTAYGEDIVDIYYTLDGTPPDSDKGKQYTNAITLTGTYTDRQKSYVVKACGKRIDDSYTDIYTHSYFIGDRIFQRFDVIVFSLSTDPYNLYDYDYGIFVEGRLRADYIKETGDTNPDPPAPANYNLRGKDSERPVYVEVFDQYGDLIISQNAGMRTFGGWSRAMDQHSIKLFARKEYDPINNSFDYDFFPDNKSINGISISEYKRLVLRNNANDNPFGFIRDETILACAELTYLPDVQKTRPAAVFLNGEYYGFVWVHEVYDDNYLDNKNDIKDGEWAILEGGETYKAEDPEDPLNRTAIDDYDEVYSYYKKDLTNDDIFSELCERIDIDNFLTYYAIQIYVANGDWPRGNYKAYRYFGDASLAFDDSTADGKWRWLLYDTDFGLGLYDCKASEKSLGTILGQTGGDINQVSPLLASLLRREDVKVKFTEIMCDLMNYQYSPSNITHIMREKEASRIQELTYDFKHGGYQLKYTWSNIDYVSGELKKIILFSIERPFEMKKQLVRYLDIEDSGYTVYAKPCKNADIIINSCLLEEDSKEFIGFYYDINTVVISANPIIGYRFSHWIINGNINEDPILNLNKDNVKDGRLSIELVVLEDDTLQTPIIKMIDYEGSMDYLQIYNPFNSDINLKKYYISDDAANLYKQVLPDFILKSGKTLNLYCKNYRSIEALGGFSLCFNLSNNETIYITSSNGETIESVFLPKISNDQIYVKDMHTGRFYNTSSE